jgi:hypothetical protein
MKSSNETKIARRRWPAWPAAWRTASFLGLIAVFAATSSGTRAALQHDTLGSGQSKTVNADLADSKLTVGDMDAVFAKLDRAIRKVCHIDGKARHAVPGNKAALATREQVILEFGRLFEIARPHFMFTPRKVKYDPSILTIKKGTRARAELEVMIPLQFVAKVGPLAAGLKPTLTLKQFGDAVGFFYARIADLTHTPSSKWSPYMNQGPQAPAPTGTARSKTSPKKP